MKINKIIAKIIGFYLLIPVCILLFLYPLLPTVLNYPPGSVNSALQVEIDSLTYTQQYILLVFIGIILSLIVLFISLYKIVNNIKVLETNNVSKTDSDKAIDKIISICIKSPLLLYFTEFIVPLIVLPFALFIIGAQPVVVVKISLIIVLSLMLSSILCYTFSQKEFRNILNYIHIKYPNRLSNVNDIKIKKIFFKLNSFTTTFLLKLVPLFIFSIIFTSLCAYNYNVRLVSDIYDETYSSLLHNTFYGKTNITSGEELISLLKEVELSNENHTRFIIRDVDNYYTDDGSELSPFFQKYTLTLSSQNENRTYDYYCIDNFGSVLPVKVNGVTYFVGIEYSATSIPFFITLVAIFIVLLIILTLMIFYIASSVSESLKNISDGFQQMHTDSHFNKQLSVTSIDEIGTLVSEFNIIQNLNQQHITQIQDNQDMLMEKERLASLGQLIGGISHNLKTPIMSISGAAEGLTDLIKEYEASVGDSDVTVEDHHAIASDMKEWVNKIHSYTAYMSDIITAVKGQAVALSENQNDVFTIDELLKRVNILMKHEIRNASLLLETNIEVPVSTRLHGDVNSLVQVVNNLITNAIHSYNGKKDETVVLTAKKVDENLVISVSDHGCGMTDEVKQKLFKSMITTKGKNGTGLGMFMSYSTIKGHFNGDITFESEVGKGTTFNIVLPLSNN